MRPQRGVTESKEHLAFEPMEQELLQYSFPGNFARLTQFKLQKIFDETSERVVETTYTFFKRQETTCTFFHLTQGD